MKRLLSAMLSAIFLAMLFSGCAEARAETELDGSNQGNNTDIISETENGETQGSKPEQQKNTTTVEYSYQYANMKLELPAGWEYEIMPGAGENDETGTVDGPAKHFGIRFWPQAQPLMTINLHYRVDGIGLCATGVTFEDVSFANGLTATKCTEGIEDEFWFLLIYHDVPGTYTVECVPSKDLWSNYENAIMSILESVEIGKNILSETEAIEIAKAGCNVSYDTVRAYFDYASGVWKICFSTNDLDGGDQTIWIDAQGEIQDSVYGK